MVVLAICGAILLYSGLNGFESTVFTDTIQGIIVDMRHIQYQGETLPPFPLVLAFHLVLGKFHSYIIVVVLCLVVVGTILFKAPINI